MAMIVTKFYHVFPILMNNYEINILI